MSLILSLLSGIGHIGYLVFRQSSDRGGDPIYSVVAEALLWFAFLVLFVAVWKFYCLQWKQLADQSILRVITEKVWMPFVTLFLVTDPRYFFSEKMELEIVMTGVVLLIALMDWDQSILRTVKGVLANRPAMDQRLLYSNYPPRKRSDMLPMDVLINTVVFFMIIKKII